MVALKWPDRPHWEFDATVLGADVHGVWVGAPRGTTMRRPGVEFRAAQDQVTLVPHDRPFIATFYAGDGGPMPCEVYVDISTVPTWRDGRVSSIDLDLDVLRGWSGRVWVDDEDEFASHRVTLDYPREVVRLATRSCDEVRAAVQQRTPPYDAATPRTWFDVMAAAGAGS